MKKLKFIIVLLLSMVVLVPSVNALPVFKADESLNIKEDYNDTAFFAANNINSESYINGLNFSAANNIIAKGESDYAFMAGNSITINEYKSKDLFIAGNTINVNGLEARSVYAAANNININADLESVYASADTVTLTGTFDNVNVAGNTIKIDGEVNGTLTINEDAKIELAEGTIIANTVKYESKTHIEADGIISGAIAVFVWLIIKKILHFINILIIGLIFMSIFKKGSEKIKNMEDNGGSIFARFGFGFITLICAPIACLLLTCTGILTDLGIIGILSYVIGIMMSEIFANIYLSTHIFKNMNMYLGYFLMLLLTTVIGIVPIIGWLFKFFILCFGLGVIIKTIKTEEKQKEKRK